MRDLTMALNFRFRLMLATVLLMPLLGCDGTAELDEFKNDPSRESLFLGFMGAPMADNSLQPIPASVADSVPVRGKGDAADSYLRFRIAIDDSGIRKIFKSNFKNQFGPIDSQEKLQRARHMIEVLLVGVDEFLDSLERGHPSAVVDASLLFVGLECLELERHLDPTAIRRLFEKFDAEYEPGDSIPTELKQDVKRLALETSANLKRFSLRFVSNRSNTKARFRTLVERSYWPALTAVLMTDSASSGKSQIADVDMSERNMLNAATVIAANGSPEIAAYAIEFASRHCRNLQGDSALETSALEDELKNVVDLATAKKHPKSFLTAGQCYQKSDPKLALSYFDQGAILNDVHCMNLAGNACLNQHAVGSSAESYRRAETYYRKSLANGEISAAAAVGMALFRAGKQADVRTWCADRAMRDNPDQIYRLAEYVYSFDEPFGREIMRIAYNTSKATYHTDTAGEAFVWLRDTDPEVLRQQRSAENARRAKERKIERQREWNRRQQESFEKEWAAYEFRQWVKRQR